jgi:hypothetical protein
MKRSNILIQKRPDTVGEFTQIAQQVDRSIYRHMSL